MRSRRMPVLSSTLVAVVMLGAAGCGDPRPADVAAPVRTQDVQPDPLAVAVTVDLAAKLRMAPVGRSEVRDRLRVPARIEVDETRMARVGSPVAGRLTDLDAVVGQRVRRGQVLARINSTELSGAQLGFLKALSQRQLADRAAMRAQQLLDAEVIGTAELQRRQSELVQADAEVSAARGQLKVLGMSDEAVRNLAETGTINSLAYIVSTISGTVIERKVTEGQVVQPADGVFLVADLARVWVVADIPEQGAALARPGETTEAEVAALPGRRFPGRLTFVAPTINPETRTVRVRMDLDNAEGLLKPAMLATMYVEGRSEPRMTVPTAAVVREDNRDLVYVRTGEGRFVARPVALGTEYRDLRVVVSGVAEGEVIVTEGAFHLHNERRKRAQDGGPAS